MQRVAKQFTLRRNKVTLELRKTVLTIRIHESIKRKNVNAKAAHAGNAVGQVAFSDQGTGIPVGILDQYAGNLDRVFRGHGRVLSRK